MFRMKTLSLSLLLALSAAGCAVMGDRAAMPSWRVEPSPLVIHGAGSADASYRAGRWYHASLRYDAAAAAYRQALRLEPGHAAARNGLGVVLSTLGRHDEAVRELQAAVSQDPKQAHVRNNLGYAHYLSGALARALSELELAKQLDPANRKVEENLRLVRARLSPPVEPQSEPQPPKGPVPTAPAPASPPDESDRRIVLVAPNVYEMREPPSVQPPRETVLAQAVAPLASTRPVTMLAHYRAASAAPAARASTGLSRPRLEVSNGNGLNGFARRIAAALSRLGWSGGRLTNQLPFQQAATEIHYREGYAEEAVRLASTLKPGVLVIRSDALAAQVDVRLVLGRDAWSERALLHPSRDREPDTRLVAHR